MTLLHQANRCWPTIHPMSEYARRAATMTFTDTDYVAIDYWLCLLTLKVLIDRDLRCGRFCWITINDVYDSNWAAISDVAHVSSWADVACWCGTLVMLRWTWHFCWRVRLAYSNGVVVHMADLIARFRYAGLSLQSKPSWPARPWWRHTGNPSVWVRVCHGSLLAHHVSVAYAA